MNTGIEVTKVLSTEAEPLQKICWQTFSETFSEYNSKENMKQYLNSNFSLEKIKAELNHPNSHFFFAKFKAERVGYLKLNTGSAQTEFQEKDSLEIERIYIKEAFQRKGLGQLLMWKAMEMATVLKTKIIWLGVWEKNEKAIQFYRKNGFTVFDRHVFILGDDPQTDLLMKKPFT